MAMLYKPGGSGGDGASTIAGVTGLQSALDGFNARLLALESGATGSAGPLNSYNWDATTQFPNFKTAKAAVDAGTGRAIVLTLGDSTTSGFGGTRAQAWPAMLAGSIAKGSRANFYSDGGVPNFEPRLTFRGATYMNTFWTVGGSFIAVPTGSGFNFTPGTTFNSIRVPCVNLGGSFTLQIDNGPLVTPVGYETTEANSNVNVLYEVPRGSGVIKIDGTGGDCFISGVEVHDTQARTIDVINGGISGAKSDAVLGDYYLNAVKHVGADLTTINFGINDASAGFSKATYKGHVSTLVTGAKASGSDVILCVPTPVEASQPLETTALPDYRAALREIAIEQNVPLVDLHARYVSHALQSAKSPSWYADALHPAAPLYADEGQFFASVLAAI